MSSSDTLPNSNKDEVHVRIKPVFPPFIPDPDYYVVTDEMRRIREQQKLKPHITSTEAYNGRYIVPSPTYKGPVTIPKRVRIPIIVPEQQSVGMSTLSNMSNNTNTLSTTIYPNKSNLPKEVSNPNSSVNTMTSVNETSSSNTVINETTTHVTHNIQCDNQCNNSRNIGHNDQRKYYCNNHCNNQCKDIHNNHHNGHCNNEHNNTLIRTHTLSKESEAKLKLYYSPETLADLARFTKAGLLTLELYNMLISKDSHAKVFGSVDNVTVGHIITPSGMDVNTCMKTITPFTVASDTTSTITTTMTPMTTVNTTMIKKNKITYKPLVYTNHVLNGIQNFIFLSNYECNIIGMANLFVMLTNFLIDKDTKLFNICMFPTYLFVVNDLLSLNDIISDTLGDFIDNRIISLVQYKHLINKKQFRYSEMLTTQFYCNERYNGDYDAEFRAVINFDSNIWNDMKLWENSLKQNHNYVVECIDDPYVVKVMPLSEKYGDLITNAHYNSLLNSYKDRDKPLAERFHIYFSALFGGDISMTDLPTYFYTDIDNRRDDLSNHIDYEIDKLTNLAVKIRKNKSDIHINIKQAIIDNGKMEFNSSALGTRQYLLGLDNNKVVDVRTLCQRQRTVDDGIQFVYPYDYHITASTSEHSVSEHSVSENMTTGTTTQGNTVSEYLSALLYQMSGGDNNIIMHIKTILGLLLCVNPKYTFLYGLMGDGKTSELLCNILNKIWGNMYCKIMFNELTGSVSDKLQNLMASKSVIVVTDVTDKRVSTSMLRYYFDRQTVRSSGGRKYLVNTSLVFDCDFIPTIPEYYYNFFYGIKLCEVEEGFHINEIPEDVYSELYVMAVQTANMLSQDDYTFELSFIPPFPSIFTKPPPYHVDTKKYEELNLNAVIVDFINRRVNFSRSFSQSYVKIKANFIKYLIDIGYTQSHALSDDLFSKRFPEVLATFNKWFDAKAQSSVTEGKRGRAYKGIETQTSDIN